MIPMEYDPCDGSFDPHPADPDTYREKWPEKDWLYDPWTRYFREEVAVANDPLGVNIVPARMLPTIIWDQVKAGYDWLAKDRNGGWYLYTSPPRILRENSWVGENPASPCAMRGFEPGRIYWKHSLTARPGVSQNARCDDDL